MTAGDYDDIGMTRLGRLTIHSIVGSDLEFSVRGERPGDPTYFAHLEHRIAKLNDQGAAEFNEGNCWLRIAPLGSRLGQIDVRQEGNCYPFVSGYFFAPLGYYPVAKYLPHEGKYVNRATNTILGAMSDNDEAALFVAFSTTTTSIESVLPIQLPLGGHVARFAGDGCELIVTFSDRSAVVEQKGTCERMFGVSRSTPTGRTDDPVAFDASGTYDAW